MNSHQLVIRCDTANGYYKVGWAAELPLGRFKHIELLVETDNLSVLNSNNPQHVIYKKACDRVSELNLSLIIKEHEEKQALGWRDVALNLNDNTVQVLPDEFGCFNILATKTRYRLSKNSSQVWAVILSSEVVQIKARYPTRRMAELEYQIWKNHRLDKLSQYGGEIFQGALVVCCSGLWFIEES